MYVYILIIYGIIRNIIYTYIYILKIFHKDPSKGYKIKGSLKKVKKEIKCSEI